jgi:DNA-binding transcriptional LysR family regulator
VARVADVSRGRDGVELHLISSLTVGEFLLPAWLAQFRELRPDVRPALELANSRAVLEAVREDHREIGFVEGNASLRGLQTLTLARDEIVVAVAASHPWARRRALHARDLTSESYITREASSGTRAVAQAALAHAGIELEPTLQMASTQSLKRTLASGGFTLISRLAIEDERHAHARWATRRRPRSHPRPASGCAQSPRAKRSLPRLLALDERHSQRAPITETRRRTPRSALARFPSGVRRAYKGLRRSEDR